MADHEFEPVQGRHDDPCLLAIPEIRKRESPELILSRLLWFWARVDRQVVMVVERERRWQLQRSLSSSKDTSQAGELCMLADAWNKVRKTYHEPEQLIFRTRERNRLDNDRRLDAAPSTEDFSLLNRSLTTRETCTGLTSHHRRRRAQDTRGSGCSSSGSRSPSCPSPWRSQGLERLRRRDQTGSGTGGTTEAAVAAGRTLAAGTRSIPLRGVRSAAASATTC